MEATVVPYFMPTISNLSLTKVTKGGGEKARHYFLS